MNFSVSPSRFSAIIPHACLPMRHDERYFKIAAGRHALTVFTRSFIQYTSLPRNEFTHEATRARRAPISGLVTVTNQQSSLAAPSVGPPAIAERWEAVANSLRTHPASGLPRNQPPAPVPYLHAQRMTPAVLNRHVTVPKISDSWIEDPVPRIRESHQCGWETHPPHTQPSER